MAFPPMSRSRSQQSARFRSSSESSKARELRGVDRADGLEPQTQLSSTSTQAMAPTRRRRRSIRRDHVSPGTRAGVNQSCKTTTLISPHTHLPDLGEPGSGCASSTRGCELRTITAEKHHSAATVRMSLGTGPLTVSRSLHNVGVGYRRRIGDRQEPDKGLLHGHELRRILRH